MKKSNLFCMVALITVIVMAITACTSQQAATTAPVASASPTAQTEEYMDKSVSIGISSSWGSLCPYAASDQISTALYDNLYEKLVFIDGDYSISPRAAKSWEASEDGKVLTFHLDENMTWHDGQPVTAGDWVFAAQMATNADYATVRKASFAVFEGTDDSGNETSSGSIAWTAQDDYTLQMTLKNGTEIEAFLGSNNLSFYPLPKHLLSDVPAAELLENSFWLAPVGCGALKYESETTGTELVLATNQDYYQGAPKFGKLIYKVIATDAQAAAFISGELDLSFSTIYLDDCKAIEASSNGAVTVDYAGIPNGIYMLAYNNATLSDTRIRKAISCAIDRDQIINVIFQDLAKKTLCPFITGGDYYMPSIDESIVYDLQKAKALLDEAGFDYSKTYTFGAVTGVRANIAAMMQQSLEEIGVKIEIQTGDAYTILTGLRSGNYDMGMWGTTMITTDPATCASVYSPGVTFNFGMSDEYAKLLGNISASTSKEARVQAAQDFQTYYIEDCPDTVVCHILIYNPRAVRVQNYDIQASTSGINNAVWNWVID